MAEAVKKELEVQEDVRLYMMLQDSILFFVERMWGLVPQPCLPEYKDKLREIVALSGEQWEKRKSEIRPEWFGRWNEGRNNWDWYHFEKGKHITWQQYVILLSMEKAQHRLALRKISVASGHGIGKSAVLSWIILWFLFCFHNAQVPCTAPTSDQMHDVLWKELDIWIHRMPPGVAELYDHQRGYIRIKESPKTWYARAKTAAKENSEALAGVHSDFVLLCVDEASGVHEQIFNVAQSALTSENVFLVMIGNPTRIVGYFYDSHHKLKASFQTATFSSIDSPIVDADYEREQAMKHGRESDEYGFRVLGKFPRESAMDDQGWVRLFGEDVKFIEAKEEQGDKEFVGRRLLGHDPAGAGKNEAVWYGRDNHRARLLGSMDTSNEKEQASRTLTLMDKYKIHPRDTVLDNFGAGANIALQVSAMTRGKKIIRAINVGDKPRLDRDKEIFINIRAMLYWRAKQWLRSGGEIVFDPILKNELSYIMYRRTESGKIQIMSKKDMAKMGYPSPNRADALSLTFLEDITSKVSREAEASAIEDEVEKEMFDKFGVI